MEDYEMKNEAMEQPKQPQRAAVSPEKLKALQVAMDKIDKTYGKGSIMKLGDRPTVDFDVISSGSLLLDNALGVGGYPKGRIIEIFGPESSGKTTFLNVLSDYIPKEVLSHLFEKFTRVDDKTTRETRGTGLGLYIVKGVVKAMNGEVAIYSTQDRTFKIEIKFLILFNFSYNFKPNISSWLICNFCIINIILFINSKKELNFS